MREIRLNLLISLLSVALGFTPHPLDRPRVVPGIIRHTTSPICMAIKSKDIDENDSSSDDEALSGVSRFAVMGGMFRGKESENDDDPDEQEDEAGFLKSVSRRLSFRRENDKEVNGVQEPKKSSGFLRMVGLGKDPKSREEAKSLAMLQKEKELNRKRQLIIAEQKKRDDEREKEIKLEEKRIAELIAKAEAEQRRDEERRRREAAKLEKVKAKEEAKLAAKQKRDEVPRQEDEKEVKKPMSVAGKFFANVWNTTTSAFGRGEEEQWVPLIPKTRIEPGEIVPVQVQGIDLLVVASRDGKVHCLTNSCSHMGTPLDTGRLESRPKKDASGIDVLANSITPRVECEDCIICPLHHTAFSLETGEVRGEWCPYPPVLGSVLGTVKKTAPVPTFDIRTRGKFIEVRLNSPV